MCVIENPIGDVIENPSVDVIERAGACEERKSQ